MDFMWHLSCDPLQNDLFKISEGVSGILTLTVFSQFPEVRGMGVVDDQHLEHCCCEAEFWCSRIRTEIKDSLRGLVT